MSTITRDTNGQRFYPGDLVTMVGDNTGRVYLVDSVVFSGLNARVKLRRLVSSEVVAEVFPYELRVFESFIVKTVSPNYPHDCPRCGHPAYVGFNEVDCSAGCDRISVGAK